MLLALHVSAMQKKTVNIPQEFVEFMQHVVETLDSDEEDIDLDYGDAIQCEQGYGGRDTLRGRFEFVFYPASAEERWFVDLDEDGIRDIADRTFDTLKVRWERCRVERKPIERTEAKLGERLLRALEDGGLLELRPNARRNSITLELEREMVQVLDTDSLDDTARGAAIGESLEGYSGVEEVFATDEQLGELARSIGASADSEHRG